MWIFTKYGFFSAVCARQGDGKKTQPVDLNRVMVRCRLKEQLEALLKRFPDELGDVELITSATTDYRFRIFVDKETWAVVIASLTLEMDYDNFKSECHAFQPAEDGGYINLLHRVWNAAYSMQSASYGPGMYDNSKKVGGGSSLFGSSSGVTATDPESGGVLVSEPEMDEDVILVLDQDTGEEVVIIWWPEIYDNDEEAYATAVTEGDANLVAHPECMRKPWGDCRWSATKVFDHVYAEVDEDDPDMPPPDSYGEQGECEEPLQEA